MQPVPRPNLTAYLTQRQALRADLHTARMALHDHRTECEACAALWPPCEAGRALNEAWRAAMVRLDVGGWK